ncbi:hypothetical protein NHX12_028463 [Muraenolepis orangiensis]|uniref:Uncharacterized protein n=1 Tax=Muraenolepis orangiensis TaxID=630683 RepID=A0A9Q0EFY0_9TELE|nr:hypothetical protein NHX12_028463 [Muraenolepis orangiensis]
MKNRQRASQAKKTNTGEAEKRNRLTPELLISHRTPAHSLRRPPKNNPPPPPTHPPLSSPLLSSLANKRGLPFRCGASAGLPRVPGAWRARVFRKSRPPSCSRPVGLPGCTCSASHGALLAESSGTTRIDTGRDGGV